MRMIIKRVKQSMPTSNIPQITLYVTQQGVKFRKHIPEDIPVRFNRLFLKHVEIIEEACQEVFESPAQYYGKVVMRYYYDKKLNYHIQFGYGIKDLSKAKVILELYNNFIDSFKDEEVCEDGQN